MIPADFPQANIVFGPPAGMDESQVCKIPAYVGQLKSGNLDGAQFTVVAWLPTSEELLHLQQGQAVYLSVLGGLPPHFLTTDFQAASYQK